MPSSESHRAAGSRRCRVVGLGAARILCPGDAAHAAPSADTRDRRRPCFCVDAVQGPGDHALDPDRRVGNQGGPWLPLLGQRDHPRPRTRLPGTIFRRYEPRPGDRRDYHRQPVPMTSETVEAVTSLPCCNCAGLPYLPSLPSPRGARCQVVSAFAISTTI